MTGRPSASSKVGALERRGRRRRAGRARPRARSPTARRSVTSMASADGSSRRTRAAAIQGWVVRRGGDRVGIDGQQAIAELHARQRLDLVGGDVGGRPRRGSRARRSAARRSRGGPAGGPRARRRATNAHHDQHLARDDQLARRAARSRRPATGHGRRARTVIAAVAAAAGTSPRLAGADRRSTRSAARRRAVAARSRRALVRLEQREQLRRHAGDVAGAEAEHQIAGAAPPRPAPRASASARATWRGARPGRWPAAPRASTPAIGAARRRRRCRSARARRRRPARARSRAADRACACSGAAGRRRPAGGRRGARPRWSPPARSDGGRSRRRPARRPPRRGSRSAGRRPRSRPAPRRRVVNGTPRKSATHSAASALLRVVNARHADVHLAVRLAAHADAEARAAAGRPRGSRRASRPPPGRRSVWRLVSRAAPGAPPRGCRRRSRPIHKTAPSRQSLKTRSHSACLGPEVVEVLAVDVGDDGDGREQVAERAVRLVGLGDQDLAAARGGRSSRRRAPCRR